jgi:hypothetical protein
MMGVSLWITLFFLQLVLNAAWSMAGLLTAAYPRSTVSGSQPPRSAWSAPRA